MEISQFIDAYIREGNVLCEAKQNLKSYLGMFAGLPKDGFPSVDPAESYTATGATPAGYLQSQGDKGDKAVMFKNGNIGYRGTGGNAPRFSFTKSPPEAVSFTPEEWQELQQMFQKEGGGDMADTAQDQPPAPDPTAPALEQPVILKQMSEEATQKDLSILKEMGYSGPDVTKWAKTFNDQARGLGTHTKMRMASLALQGKENVSLEETEAAAQKLSSTTMKAMGIAYKIKNKITTPDKLSPEDIEFLKCFRCRNRGTVHVRGGGKCGGEIADLGATMDTDAGAAFGMQIGTKKSLVAKDLCMLSDIKVDGVPLIPKGRTAEKSLEDTYRAITGDMNEYAGNLANAIFVRKNKRSVKKIMEEIVAGVGDNLDLKLFLEVAKARAGGDLDNLQVINFAEDGANELLNEATAELGATPDEKRALAWVLGKQISGWKPIVEQFPPDCEFKKIGKDGAGIQEDGTNLNADVEVSCPDGSMLDKVINKKFDVKGDRAAQSEGYGNVVRISVKNGFGGRTIEFGKRSFLKLRGSKDREAVTRVRQRHAATLNEIARNNGVKLPDDWLEKADEFRDRSSREVDRLMGALENISPGALKDWTAAQMAKVPYTDLKKQEAFFNKIKEYKKTEDPKIKLRRRAEIVTQMTQMYASKHSNDPGFRYNCVLDAAVCGMSTERQMFALTNPDGNSMMGMETDAIGPSLLKILSGETDIKVLPSGTSFLSKEGELLSKLRIGRKGTSANVHYIVSKDEATSGLETVQPVGNSNLTAEDIVGQLQELFQRINEIGLIKN